MKKSDLAKAVNDKARRIQIRGSQAIVPLKFDKAGEVVTEMTPPNRLVLKKLSLKDLAFLKAWRECDWDIAKTRDRVTVSDDEIERVVKRLQCFRDEDAKVKALAEIPTTAWVASKHVENVYNGGTLQESEHRSLQELAKIQGAYKNTAQVSITQNVFNLPKLSPEAEAQLKTIAQKELAIEAETEHAA